jgi:hypothetical protein
MYDCKQIVLDYFVKNVWAMGNERRVHQFIKSARWMLYQHGIYVSYWSSLAI